MLNSTKGKLKMKKSYNIEVECANCANKMEEAINKLEGVAKANISFITQKLKIEFKENADTMVVMKEILSQCKKIEPDCEIRA